MKLNIIINVILYVYAGLCFIGAVFGTLIVEDTSIGLRLFLLLSSAICLWFADKYAAIEKAGEDNGYNIFRDMM